VTAPPARLHLLIIPQKPWEVVTAELADYRRIYRELSGTEAPPPLVAGWTFCDPDPDRARALAERYIGGYWDRPSAPSGYSICATDSAPAPSSPYAGMPSDEAERNMRLFAAEGMPAIQHAA
jgi:hypothetical protein